jgi:hypothetical protein
MQAYQARNIKSEFAEAKYIGLTVFSLLQAFVTGIPLLAVVRDIPQAFYLVLTLFIFVLSMMILLFIFLPKHQMQMRYAMMSLAEQNKAMAVSVRRSSEMTTAEHISGLRGHDNASDKAHRFIQPKKQVELEEGMPEVCLDPPKSGERGSLVERIIDDSEPPPEKRSTYVSAEVIEA